MKKLRPTVPFFFIIVIIFKSNKMKENERKWKNIKEIMMRNVYLPACFVSLEGKRADQPLNRRKKKYINKRKTFKLIIK